MIDIPAVRERHDGHVIADTDILIQDGTFDVTIPADPNGQVSARLLHIVVVRAHEDAIPDHGPFGDLAPQADDRMGDLRFADTAAFCQQHILQFAVFHRRAGQKPRMSIDLGMRVKKIEGRVGARQFEIGLIERTDGPDILPVAIKIKSVHFMRADRFRDNIAAKVVVPQVILQEVDEHLGLE